MKKSVFVIDFSRRLIRIPYPTETFLCTLSTELVTQAFLASTIAKLVPATGQNNK